MCLELQIDVHFNRLSDKLTSQQFKYKNDNDENTLYHRSSKIMAGSLIDIKLSVHATF